MDAPEAAALATEYPGWRITADGGQLVAERLTSFPHQRVTADTVNRLRMAIRAAEAARARHTATLTPAGGVQGAGPAG
jgi:hypothetical protein